MGRTGFSRLTRVGWVDPGGRWLRGWGLSPAPTGRASQGIGCMSRVHAGPVIGQPARKNVNPGVGGSGRPRDFFRTPRRLHDKRSKPARGAVTRVSDFITVFTGPARRGPGICTLAGLWGICGWGVRASAGDMHMASYCRYIRSIHLPGVATLSVSPLHFQPSELYWSQLRLHLQRSSSWEERSALRQGSASLNTSMRATVRPRAAGAGGARH